MCFYTSFWPYKESLLQDAFWWVVRTLLRRDIPGISLCNRMLLWSQVFDVWWKLIPKLSKHTAVFPYLADSPWIFTLISLPYKHSSKSPSCKIQMTTRSSARPEIWRIKSFILSKQLHYLVWVWTVMRDPRYSQYCNSTHMHFSLLILSIEATSLFKIIYDLDDATAFGSSFFETS